jgi:hypothetical protein
LFRGASVKRFLKDEERLEQIKKGSIAYGDKARSDAVEAILKSAGESSAWLSGNGLSMLRTAIERLAGRAGLKVTRRSWTRSGSRIASATSTFGRKAPRSLPGRSPPPSLKQS